MGTGVFEYTPEPERDAANVTFTCDVRPHGFMWLLLPVLLRGNRVRYSEQLANLKKEVEKHPSSSGDSSTLAHESR